MHHLQDRSGQQIGDYRLQHYLGKGTFGTVYLAEHVHDRSLAAVKILQFQLSNREDLRDFLNEARIIRLRHPHIVSILDFGLSRDDLPFLVMEYALGGTLRNRHPRGSQVSSGTIATYVLHLASALQYAHDRRIIHRDVKPENMLLNGDSHVLLSDFGIAKIMEQSIAVSAQTQIGTPVYMAPEQSQGRPRPASDQYALAVVTYEWFTGQRPFQGGVFEVMLQHRVDKPPSLRTLRPEVSEQVEQVIFKALAKAPEERFPSVMDFAHALQFALQTTMPLIQTDPTGLTAKTRDFSNAHLASIQLPPPTVPMTQQVPPSLATEYPFPKGTPDASIPSSAPFPESIPQANPATGISAQTRPSSWPDNKQEQGTSTYILPSTPPVELSWKSTLRRPRHRWSTLLILLCLVVVIGACGSGAWLFVTHQAAQQNKLAATATAMAAPEARATTAARAYWTATAKAGAQFGFDAAHTSWNPYERIITAKNVRGLRLLWSYTTGDKIISSPTIANGTIYVGSNDHKMYAFDATCRSDCQPLRSYTTGDTIDSSPAIANGMVYIGSYDNNLYAFDVRCRRDCQPLWSYAAGDKIDSSPAIANGMVYIGSLDNSLYAFDVMCRSDCQPLWSYTAGDSVESSPAIAAGTVYVGSNDHKLYAFDATCRNACQPLWSYATGDVINSSPAIANGIVYVGSWDKKLYAFDMTCRSTCQPLWSYATGDRISSPPAIANGIVYVGSNDHKLYAFDATCRSACKPLWSYSTGGSIYFSSAAIANGVVFVGSHDRKLYAFDAACRNACLPLWAYVTGDSINSSPAIANGIVYIGSLDKKLYAFGLSGQS